MPRWIVSIPIAGSIATNVEADDMDSAIDAAWDKFNSDGAEDFDIEWEALDKIADGNVLHATQNYVEVTMIKEKR